LLEEFIVSNSSNNTKTTFYSHTSQNKVQFNEKMSRIKDLLLFYSIQSYHTTSAVVPDAVTKPTVLGPFL
jgi:hypothetical protein